ncbi:MAG: tripartite tricarboxylate transporter substrate binding protein, partial [Verrucomicrobiota bacterium]
MAVASSESLDDFPRKPIKVIVPFGPGGASDTLARIVQEAIRRDELAPEPLVMINVPGAGGTIGSRRAKNARPDGYTILNLHDGILTAKHTGHDYGAEEFIPIASTGSSHTVVCTGPEGNWPDLKQVLVEAKKRPGEVKFGMNLGAPSHFVGLQLEQKEEGASFGMIPLQGGADRFEKLVGGHVDLSIFSVSEYLQFRMTERRPNGLRAIAYLGPERHPQLAGTPTGIEVGVDLVTGTTQFWWAPKGTPADRIEKLGDILEAAMKSEWLESRYRQKSVEPICLRGDPLLQLIEEKEAQLASLNVGDLSSSGRKVPMVRFVIAAVIVFG